MRKVLKGIKSRISSNKPSGEAISSEDDVATLRHAFETTAADRDRLSQELETYRHAFETTEADRDRLAGLSEEFTAKWNALLSVIETVFEFAKINGLLKPPQGVQVEDSDGGVINADTQRLPQETQARLFVPNFYCVGAPKSGTSFVYSIIRDHPSVHVAPKDDGNLIDLVIKGPEKHRMEYLRNCNADYDGQPVFANFEVGYMMHEAGARTIKDTLSPAARILFCLRDPVHRAVSEYRMRVRQYDSEMGQFRETEDFLKAVALEDERRAARRYLYFNFYAYAARGKYADFIESYIEAFGRENVFIAILEDDIAGDRLKTMLNLFSFLSILGKDAVNISLESYDRYFDISKSPRDIAVTFRLADGSRLTDTDPLSEILDRGVELLEITSDVPEQLDLKLSKPKREDIETAYILRSRHAIELTPDEEKALYDEHFSSDVARLEKLLGRDLSIWYSRYA